MLRESTEAHEASSPQEFVDWVTPHRREEALSFLRGVSSILSSRGQVASLLDALVQSGKLREVVDFKIPTEQIELEDYRASRQIQALYSKTTWVDLGYNPLYEGVKSFVGAEDRCFETNVRHHLARPKGRVSVVQHYAIRKIAEVLGDVPPLEALNFRFGPGANTEVRMAEASVSGKLAATLTCSSDLLPTVGSLLSEFPMLVEHHSVKSNALLPLFHPEWPEVVLFKVDVAEAVGKLVFVPKTAKTHRPIVVEPPLNGLAQKGIGTYLKHRIKAVARQDLTDQSRNRRLACKGSIDGSLATIDLSSASDTLSMGTVCELVPLEWVEFLGRFRTGTVAYDGKSLELEKFSSMGNGYTFELESLIFWALAYGCVVAVDGDVTDIGIFGDDIIVPVEAVALLFEVLDWYGFWVNPQKSYWSGSFRESCGSDWLNGQDVRPFFFREEISDRTLYTFHNWAMRNCERELAQYAHDWTWPSLRIYGPDGYGDGHLIGSHDLYSKRRDRRSGFEGGYFDTYRLKPMHHKECRASDWLVPGYTVYVRSGAGDVPSDPYQIRGSDGYVRSSIYTFSTSIFIG